MTTMITRINEIDSLFDQIWRGGRDRGESGELVLRPRADVYETEKEYVLEIDLPGVAKQDLEVEVERNVLSIQAQRKATSRDDLQALHLERSANARFVRRFTLGKEVDAERIEGRFENGVLRLTVAKQEKVLPRRIRVE